MPEFSFDLSGQGEIPLDIKDVQAAAIKLGYAKPNVDSAKPLAARCDMNAFMAAYGVKAFSNFKKMFFSEKLTPVGPGGKFVSQAKKDEPEVVVQAVEVKEEDIPPIEKFQELSESYPSLKWRMISRPGGATMKPIDFYRLEGAKKQAEIGDVNIEKPMWAETGGLDFNGREAWDQWEKFKGKDTEAAKKLFLRIYAEAQAAPKANFRVF